MINRILAFFSALFAVVIAILYAMIGRSNAQRDQAKAAEAEADKINKSNAGVQDAETEIQEERDKNSAMSDDDISDSMYDEYDRARKNADNLRGSDSDV